MPLWSAFWPAADPRRTGNDRFLSGDQSAEHQLHHDQDVVAVLVGVQLLLN